MKECSLCGGKLDRNKRCTLCGLDNSKNDDMYKHMLNKSNCEHEPLTHVHEEYVKKNARGKGNTANTYSGANYQKTVKKSNKENKGVVASVVTVITVIATLLGTFGSLVAEFAEDSDYEYEEEVYVDTDPYEYVVEEMPMDGEAFHVTLEPGVYIVGGHIPQGIYEVGLQVGESGYITIEDNDNSIYYTEELELNVQEVVTDIRLYEGATFTVSSNITVAIYTENAQPYAYTEQTNPVTEEFVLKDYAVAGEDFPAGVYDIYYSGAEEDYGTVDWEVPCEDGYYYSMSIYFDAYWGEETYHNLILPEGTGISINDLEYVTLIPSEIIFSTDYDAFYENYY